MNYLKIFILSNFILLKFTVHAQNKNNIQAQNNFLINTWHEHPHQSSGDTICFKTFIYQKQTGLDNPLYENIILKFLSASDFGVQYWRACPAVNYGYTGEWSDLQNGKKLLDFGTGKCKRRDKQGFKQAG